MNTMNAQIARYQINDQLRDAQARRTVRAFRVETAERRTLEPPRWRPIHRLRPRYA